MGYYEDFYAKVEGCTKTKECRLAQRGQGNSRKIVRDLFKAIDDVLEALLHINPDDGDKEVLEAKRHLHVIKCAEQTEHDPFHTIIDVEVQVLPLMLKAIKLHKEAIENLQEPKWNL